MSLKCISAIFFSREHSREFRAKNMASGIPFSDYGDNGDDCVHIFQPFHVRINLTINARCYLFRILFFPPSLLAIFFCSMRRYSSWGLRDTCECVRRELEINVEAEAKTKRKKIFGIERCAAVVTSRCPAKCMCALVFAYLLRHNRVLLFLLKCTFTASLLSVPVVRRRILEELMSSFLTFDFHSLLLFADAVALSQMHCSFCTLTHTKTRARKEREKIVLLRVRFTIEKRIFARAFDRCDSQKNFDAIF